MKKEHEGPMVSHAGVPVPPQASAPLATLPPEVGTEDAQSLPKLPKNAVWQPDGSALLTLRRAVVQTGTDQAGAEFEHSVSQIPFYPLDGAAMLRIQAQDGEGQRALAMIQASSRLFGPLGADVFKRLDGRDFVASTLIASIFTNPGL